MSTISYSGLASGIDTGSLIEAILQQEGATRTRLQQKQAANTQRRTKLSSIRTGLMSLSGELGTLSDSGFLSRKVTSTDAQNTYVSATASGAAAGTYELVVHKLATRARLELKGSGAGYTSPNQALDGTPGTYTVVDTNGNKTAVTLNATNNTLAGLRDAINGSGAKVGASIVQVSAGVYHLVLTAKDTGKGTLGTHKDAVGIFGAEGNALGVGTEASATYSSADAGETAFNASFSLNGIEMERSTNTVNDAVDGMSFSLKKEGTASTTLTVDLDEDAIVKSMQNVLTQFNTVYKTYKDASGAGGVLAQDTSLRSLFTQIRSSLTLRPAGLPASNAFQSGAELGLKTNRDGTLTLDTTAFKAAIEKNADAVSKVFGQWGTSTSPQMAYLYATSATTDKAITANLAYDAGAVTGTLQVAGEDAVAVSGTGGVINGPKGSSFEGLSLSVTGTVTNGTFQLVRGAGQLTRDFLSGYTASASGRIAQILQSIDDQNLNLSHQISDQETRLERRREKLEAEYASLETLVSQLKSAGSSLASL